MVRLTLAAAILISSIAVLNQSLAQAAGEVNLALNPAKTGYPQVTASYTFGADDVWSTINGIKSYNDSPRDRWTSYVSSSQSDWVAIDFGTLKTFNQLKLYIFNDNGGVQPPASYIVQYWNGSAWADIADQTKTPLNPAAELNTVDFPAVTSSKLKIELLKGSASTGLVELEVYLIGSSEDNEAAAPIITAIEQLPIQSAVGLHDKPAIIGARQAYNNLTSTQQSLVTNIYKLTEAEEALAALEASLTDFVILSAFGNAAGNSVTVKFSTELDTEYALQSDQFYIVINGILAEVAEAAYDSEDPEGRSIKLELASPMLLNETAVTLSLQIGSLRTSSSQLNNAKHDIPVFTFSSLDRSHDDRIGIEDVVQIINSPTLRYDVNEDGVFDHEDVRSLLTRISNYFIF